MDFSGINAHLVDVQNEANLLAAEAVALETALTQTQNALNVANAENVAFKTENAELKARVAELEAQQPQPEPDPTPEPPPQRVVLFGASTPANARHGTSTKEEESRWFESKMGRKLGCTRHYVKAPNAWTGDGASATISSGRIPIVSFTSGGDSWSQVANGSLDGYVKSQVEALISRGGLWLKAYIGFENEPEAESPGKGSPADYVRAYERIIKVGNAAGMPAHWTTYFMEFSWQAGSGRNPEAWIPPSIDTLGVHGYSTRVGTCGDGARSFFNTFDGPHATAEKHGKRMGIFEAGYATKAGTDPKIKGDFFRSIPAALEKLPLVDAYTYWNNSGGRCDYPNSYFIDSSDEALQGWVDAGKAPILGG